MYCYFNKFIWWSLCLDWVLCW